jgi:hypothetical protein
MEMRIVVPDRASASALAERLTSVVGSERVSLRGERRQVDVVLDREPERTLVPLVDAVARWFEHARVASAEMWLGDRSYRLAQWTQGDA